MIHCVSTFYPVYEQYDCKDDDYTEIRVLRDLPEPLTITSYEKTYRTQFIAQTFHKYNGLDGKVSRIEITPGRN